MRVLGLLVGGAIGIGISADLDRTRRNELDESGNVDEITALFEDKDKRGSLRCRIIS